VPAINSRQKRIISAVPQIVPAENARAVAIRTDIGEFRVAEGGLLALPDAQEPVACVYQDPAGERSCGDAFDIGTLCFRLWVVILDHRGQRKGPIA
jgi:hypothetical protein